MIDITNSHGIAHIVERVEDLPSMAGVKRMFLDAETQSWTPKRGGDRPYSGDRVAGWALTRDDEPDAFYIPYRHTDGHWNLPVESVQRWLKDAVLQVPEWVNHNIKFDARFMAVEGDGFVYDGRLIDTLVLSKILNSDRFGHGLKVLCREELGMAMDEAVRMDSWLKGMGSNNYADVPADICGEYACMDVWANRDLWRWQMERLPEQSRPVWETEVKLTSVLFDMEHRGLRIDPQMVKVQLVRCLRTMLEVGEKIAEISGREFVNSNDHLFDLLCNQLGLPIIKWNFDKAKEKVTGPSFDKEALALYSVHPAVLADPNIKQVIELIAIYRTESTFKGLFLEPWLEMVDERGLLHTDYNQLIRTGRMSARNPNSQQLNKRAKALILPHPGKAFLSTDASQIEFRFIIHYINDLAAIEAYKNDPKTDFHQWVADMCHIKRGPAKNVNFAIGYGAGKRKVVSMLRQNPDIMEEIGLRVNEMIAQGKITPNERDTVYKGLCQDHAAHIYEDYHHRLPGIKRLSQHAMRKAKTRGFVFNAFGLRRYLHPKGVHKAFNTIIQGGAMCYIKERMVALSPRFNRNVRDMGIDQSANVHDEILWEGTADVLRDSTTQSFMMDGLCHQVQPFRVPFRWSMGFSETSWAEAAGDDVVLDADGRWQAGPVPACPTL